MTHPNPPPDLSIPRTPLARAHANARDTPARRVRTRGVANFAAVLCAASLCAGTAQARKPHPPKPASAPSTSQILGPSAATVPDALPPDRLIYRCGNTYSPHACPDSKPLAIADARSEAQRRQSEELTARDKRMAAWLEAERQEREKAVSAPAPGRRASAAAACTSTTMMTCVPKKPRTRTVVSTTTSSATPSKSR